MKNIKLIIILIIMSPYLFGCSNSNDILTNKDYELSNNNITSKNITIGSSSEEFIKAYDNYYANVMYGNHNNSERADISAIDYSDFCYVLIGLC